MKEDFLIKKEYIIDNLLTDKEKENVINKEYTLTVAETKKEITIIVTDTKSFNEMGKKGYNYISKQTVCVESFKEGIIGYLMKK